ncbi:hypothetical protein BV898_04055 [Hypsibius exemplaris]|uniref:LysM domain-containing protein n=1 Tax=Hypsibius exemplaris TaxID=2072580 RepID=A0A1W0X340_HYPEX|nr:hypothetical protein BV898_04055 [Hypsibius exemplaris]
MAKLTVLCLMGLLTGLVSQTKGTCTAIVNKGDNCWRLAQAYGFYSVDRLRDINKGINCGNLQIGSKIIVRAQQN